MEQMITQYWWLWLIALVIGIAVAWLVFVAARRTTVERDDGGDVLDEGAAPAQRNQALIDASPPLAPNVSMTSSAVGTIPLATPIGVVGAGTAVAAAAQAMELEPDRAADGDPDPDEPAPSPAPAPAPAPTSDRPVGSPVEPTTPAPPPLPSTPPAPAAAPAPIVSQEPAGDDLTNIKGVGPKLAARLNALGITRYAQIAGWDDAEQARIDSQLDRFAGRPARDEWIVQARLLDAGDTAGFADRFGNM